jgi:riboflavin kinase
MDSTSLLYLLSRLFDSPKGTLKISTIRLGGLIGLSQQSTSRILRELSRRGLIEKTVSGRGHEIKLTPKGVSELRGMKRSLDDFFASAEEASFEGSVTKGLGEGAYYVRAYEEKISRKLGFKPYPGTLNVRLERSPHELLRYTSVEVSGFEEEGRRYGSIRFAPVRITHGGKNADCFFVLPERTHHREEAEFISNVNLREKLKLSDGGRIKITFKL